jgi:hypothetical protein
MKRQGTPWAVFVPFALFIAFAGWCVVRVGDDEWTEVR